MLKFISIGIYFSFIFYPGYALGENPFAPTKSCKDRIKNQKVRFEKIQSAYNQYPNTWGIQDGCSRALRKSIDHDLERPKFCFQNLLPKEKIYALNF